MNKEKFWNLIDKARAAAGGVIRNSYWEKEPQFCDHLERELASLDTFDLIKWQHIFDIYYKIMIDDSRIWAAAHFINGYCSRSGLSNFKNWLIANGEKIYMTAIYDPDDLADFEINFYASLEGLSRVAEKAFVKKIGLWGLKGSGNLFKKAMKLCKSMTEEDIKSITSEVIIAPYYDSWPDAINSDDGAEVEEFFCKLKETYNRGWETICSINETGVHDSSTLDIHLRIDL